jgi:hypothetical protein
MTGTPAARQHAHLVDLIGDAIRAGLDSLRINLGPRVERILVDRTVEHIEVAGYRLVLSGDDEPATHHAASSRRPDDEGGIRAKVEN